MIFRFFQRCKLALTNKLRASNVNSSLNKGCCIYCFKDGTFSANCSMDEMIAYCPQFVGKVNEHLPKPMTKEDYKQMMSGYLPNLKCKKQ